MQIDFTKYSEMAQSSNQGPRADGPRVNYFYLRNDGDEALVRFMIDSPADFSIAAVHQHSINGRMRNVNCLRAPEEPTDNCPFCAAGEPVRYRMYVKLIEYVRNEQGQIEPVAKVWERPASYANTLKNLMAEYGPLSDVLFKIKRSGAAGSTSTRYNELYANPQAYPPQTYPKMPELFEGYDPLKSAVVNRDFQGMLDLLAGKDTSAPANNYSGPTAGAARPATRTYSPTFAPAAQPAVRPTVAPVAPATAPAAPANYGAAEPAPAVTRPQRRFY